MCGRYSYVLRASTTAARLNERYPAADIAWDPESRERYDGGSYNVAPSTTNPVVVRESPATVALQRWGLVPQWADEPRDRELINARSETVHEKPAFRESFRERRCLVPAQGFFEWGPGGDGPKRPHRVVPRDDPDDLLLFAGIWSEWTGPPASVDDDGAQCGLDAFGGGAPDAGEDGNGSRGEASAGDDAAGGERTIRSYAILTMPANDALADVHDRMPVMLRDDELAAWLRGDAGEARALLDDAGVGSEALEVYPVTRAVNDPGNDSAETWIPADG